MKKKHQAITPQKIPAPTLDQILSAGIRGSRELEREARGYAKDEAKKRGLDGVSCRSGCARCCHAKIVSSPLDGAFIYLYHRKILSWNDSTIKMLQESDAEMSSLTHAEFMIQRRACPFLVDNIRPTDVAPTGRGWCSIYEVRPIACRVTFSIGNPDDCWTAGAKGAFQIGLHESPKLLLAAYSEVRKMIGVDRVYTLPGAVLIAASYIEKVGLPDLKSVEYETLKGKGEEVADEFDRQTIGRV